MTTARDHIRQDMIGMRTSRVTGQNQCSAEQDLDAIFAGRFRVKEELGFKFLEMVEHALALLVGFPELGPIYFPPFRRFLLRDRAIGLFYTVEGRRLFVQMLCDLRQNPKSLRRRLRG